MAQQFRVLLAGKPSVTAFGGGLVGKKSVGGQKGQRVTGNSTCMAQISVFVLSSSLSSHSLLSNSQPASAITGCVYGVGWDGLGRVLGYRGYTSTSFRPHIKALNHSALRGLTQLTWMTSNHLFQLQRLQTEFSWSRNFNFTPPPSGLFESNSANALTTRPPLHYISVAVQGFCA